VAADGTFVHTAFIKPTLAVKKAPTKKMVFSDDEDTPQ
jgi:hypothetical protein